MVDLATLKAYWRVGKLSPLAKCLRVTASFSPGLPGSLILVLSLWISGPSLCSSSWNSSGGIQMKFWYAIGSSNSSIGISLVYLPSSSCSAWLNHGLTQYLLGLHCPRCRPHLLLNLSIIAVMMTNCLSICNIKSWICIRSLFHLSILAS